MAQYDDLNVKKIAIVGVISIGVTVVTALAVQVLFYALADVTDSAKVASAKYTRQNEVLAAQTAEISHYGVNPDNAKVTIPIETAMKMIVAESAKPEN